MPRKESITYELLAQQTPENEITFTGVIEKVTPQKLQSGRTAEVMEYVNADGEIKRVTVWDKKIADALRSRSGQAIDIRLRKNDKGFWNLALTREELGIAKEQPTEKPVEAAKAVETTSTTPTPPQPLRESLERRSPISPDIALSKAVDTVIHFSSVLEPKSKDEIMKEVVEFYQAFLNIDYGKGN